MTSVSRFFIGTSFVSDLHDLHGTPKYSELDHFADVISLLNFNSCVKAIS